MKVKILLFGRLIELLDQEQLLLEDVADTNEVRSRLELQFPALSYVKYRLAVDQTVINGNKDLTDGMTVALMPPFSGG